MFDSEYMATSLNPLVVVGHLTQIILTEVRETGHEARHEALALQRPEELLTIRQTSSFSARNTLEQIALTLNETATSEWESDLRV